MDLTKKAIADTPFKQFLPHRWDYRNNKEIFSITRDHGIESQYVLHNHSDPINDNREDLEKVLIEYRINGNSYDLFRIDDLLNSSFRYDYANSGSILGEIGEQISRRITKYFLKHYSPHGNTGGIFDKRFNPLKKEGYVVANTEEYILKIQKYPNLVLLRKTGKGKFGYEKIKEIDGLFDYRFFNKRHLIILESKLESLCIRTDQLKYNLFSPLTLLFPDSSFSYILFSLKDSIYQKREYKKNRKIKKSIADIYTQLIEDGIPSLFFTFNEDKKDFEKMKDHLINQYRLLNNMHVTLTNKTVVSDNEIIIYGSSSSPLMRLIKDKTGNWMEAK